LYLNSKQKTVSIFGIIVIIGMCIFPPWTYTYKSSSTYSETPAGYSFIAEPPRQRTDVHKTKNGVKIDTNRLLIQIVAGASFIGLGLLIFSRTTDKK
jgi:hypothetical protein